MTKNIGEILQKARKEKGLGLQAISKRLFIKAHYLESIENNEFYLIPSKPQLLGFIKAYADHLDLDAEELMSSLTEKPEEEVIIPKPESDIDETSTANKLKSQQIFLEIGNQLRDNREKLGISLDDVASYTHINPIHIDAIENGDIDKFSSAAQSRGMIRNYSDFLGMDTSRLLVRFAEALQTKIGIITDEDEVPEPEPVEEVETPDKKPIFKLREIFNLDMAVFGIVGVLIIFFLFWGVGRMMRVQSEIEPVLTPTEVVEAEETESADTSITFTDIIADDETSEDDLENEANDAIPTIQVVSGNSLTINVMTSIRTYLRIIVDGEVEFDGRVIGGTNMAFSAQDSIEVITGNGSAVDIIYNSTQLGPMGIFGEAVHTIYTRDGRYNPTPVPLDD